MALETIISIKAKIVIIQKPFIGSWEIFHSGFNFYWLLKERKEIEVMTVVKKNLKNKIMIDHKTNLIYYPYSMLFEICKLDLQSKKPKRKNASD